MSLPGASKVQESGSISKEEIQSAYWPLVPRASLSLQGAAIKLRMRGLGEPPSSLGCHISGTRLSFLQPGSARQGAPTSGPRLSLSPKSQPYFLLTEDSREAAIHRRGDPDGLGGGGYP